MYFHAISKQMLSFYPKMYEDLKNKEQAYSYQGFIEHIQKQLNDFNPKKKKDDLFRYINHYPEITVLEMKQSLENLLQKIERNDDIEERLVIDFLQLIFFNENILDNDLWFLYPWISIDIYEMADLKSAGIKALDILESENFYPEVTYNLFFMNSLVNGFIYRFDLYVLKLWQEEFKKFQGDIKNEKLKGKLNFLFSLATEENIIIYTQT